MVESYKDENWGFVAFLKCFFMDFGVVVDSESGEKYMFYFGGS